MSLQSDAAKKHIEKLLKDAYPGVNTPTWVSEYPFNERNLVRNPKTGRLIHNWRFDYAVPSLKMAIELQGGIWNQPNAHLNDKYLEKMNAAAKDGWCVFYYTPKMVIKAGRKTGRVNTSYGTLKQDLMSLYSPERNSAR